MTALLGRFGALDAESFTEHLVTATPASLTREAGRAGAGLLLASVYGLALGTRDGGSALWLHAAGVPAGLAAVALVGVPSLFVFLALGNAPIAPEGALSAATRALGITGLVLAGLAPTAALFLVTIESTVVAASVGGLGLAAAGLLGLAHLLGGLSRQLRSGGPLTRSSGNAALAIFAFFAVGLCLRVWWGLLPLLGGAS